MQSHMPTSMMDGAEGRGKMVFVSRLTQPQWGQAGVLRPFRYTHTQPQWRDVAEQLESKTGASARVEDLLAIHPTLLGRAHTCFTCHRSRAHCNCTRCHVCERSVGINTRHHCRCCDKAVCTSCWTKWRQARLYTSASDDQEGQNASNLVRVCDMCAARWGLIGLSYQPPEQQSVLWGVYALLSVAELPRLCAVPQCNTLTYLPTCYVCQAPTVTSEPHARRTVNLLHVSNRRIVEQLIVLDAQARQRRVQIVNGYGVDDVTRVFRECFPAGEELGCFRCMTGDIGPLGISHVLLLAVLVSGLSYEYRYMPSLTLALSDVPYAGLLKIIVSQPRYSIFELPGKVKLIAFPGTHDLRTTLIDMRLSWVQVTPQGPAVQGAAIDNSGDTTRGRDGGRGVPQGYAVHSGFYDEARAVDLPMAALVADIEAGYQLIFCGHSLGGAVAQLVTLDFLQQLPPRLRGVNDSRVPLLCVAVGSPLVGNRQLAERVRCCGWDGYFHSVVFRQDVIPRLGCIDQIAWTAIEGVVGGLLDAVQGVQDWLGTLWPNSRRRGAATVIGAAHTMNDEELTERQGHKTSTATAVAGVSYDDEDASEENRDDGENEINLTARQATSVTDERELLTLVDTIIRRGRDTMSGAAQQTQQQQQQAPCEAPGGYACFGRFHFLEYGKRHYYSTSDPDAAFDLLKEGAGGRLDLLDHKINTYTRALFLHVHRNRRL